MRIGSLVQGFLAEKITVTLQDFKLTGQPSKLRNVRLAMRIGGKKDERAAYQKELDWKRHQ